MLILPNAFSVGNGQSLGKTAENPGYFLTQRVVSLDKPIKQMIHYFLT